MENDQEEDFGTLEIEEPLGVFFENPGEDLVFESDNDYDYDGNIDIVIRTYGIEMIKDEEEEDKITDEVISVEEEGELPEIQQLIPEMESECFLLGGGRRKMGNRKNGVRRKKQKNNYERDMRRDQRSVIVPDSFRNVLVYNDADLARSSVGSTFLGWRFKLNDIFDVDPLLATGSLAGFSQLAALYRFYTVTSVIVECEVANQDTFPVHIVMVPSDIDLLPFIPNRIAAVNAAENSRAVGPFVLAGITGMNRHRFRLRINLAKFSGKGSAYVDCQQYGALVNASPSRLMYVNFVVYTNGLVNFAQPLSVATKFRFTVLWNQKQPLLN